MIDHFAVIVPAHNEEDEILGCLSSIMASLEHARGSAIACPAPEPDFQVIVVADACTDGTRELVEDFALKNPIVELLTTSFNTVGSARNAAGEYLIQTMGGLPAHRLEATWIAFTDADSRVPQDWVHSHLREARNGTDCLVGTVAPRPETGSAALIATWHAAHDLAEDHPYVFGANLGLRASCFETVKGIPALTCGEDAALVEAIVTAGGTVRSTDACRVLTSARLKGRTEGGFSSYLRNLV